MNTEQIAEISWRTCMAKGQPWLAHHLDQLRLITATAYVHSYLLDYLILFHKKVMFHHLEHSKHLYVHGIFSPHLTLQMCKPF